MIAKDATSTIDYDCEMEGSSNRISEDAPVSFSNMNCTFNVPIKLYSKDLKVLKEETMSGELPLVKRVDGLYLKDSKVIGQGDWLLLPLGEGTDCRVHQKDLKLTCEVSRRDEPPGSVWRGSGGGTCLAK